MHAATERAASITRRSSDWQCDIRPCSTDIRLSDLFCLKRFWAEVAVGTVSEGSIGIDLGIFEDRLSHVSPGGAALAVNSFNFQCMTQVRGGFKFLGRLGPKSLARMGQSTA